MRLHLRLFVCPVTLHFSGSWTMFLPTLVLTGGLLALTLLAMVGAVMSCVGFVQGCLGVANGLGWGFSACRWLLILSGVWNWWVTKEWSSALKAWLFALCSWILCVGSVTLFAVAIVWAAPDPERFSVQLAAPRGVEVWYPANHPKAVGVQKRTDGDFTITLDAANGLPSWQVRGTWPEETMLEIRPLQGDVSLFGPAPLPKNGEPLKVECFAMRLTLSIMSNFRRGVTQGAVLVRVYPKGEPERLLVQRVYLLSDTLSPITKGTR